MAEEQQSWTLSRRSAEIGFALFTLGVGGVIVLGARELDYGWTRSGPEAGYFPLRVGLLLIGASALVLLRALLDRGPSAPVMTASSAARMAWFFAPLLLLVATAPWLGMYLAITLYLVVALGVVGRVAWAKTLSVALLGPTLLFALFEFFFKVPLPKGPLGPLLGIY
jgi:putative tricarboxylic transport membrane protein